MVVVDVLVMDAVVVDVGVVADDMSVAKMVVSVLIGDVVGVVVVVADVSIGCEHK